MLALAIGLNSFAQEETPLRDVENTSESAKADNSTDSTAYDNAIDSTKVDNAADTTKVDEKGKKTKKKKKKKEVVYNEKGEIIKTGLNFGPLPVIAYDADRGFQYGAILNIYNFGNGDTYPNPKSHWYIEASAYTGGTWKLYLNWDKREIFKNTRLSICANYLDESALDFYGFNGSQSIFTYADPKEYIANYGEEFRFITESGDSKTDKKGADLQKQFNEKNTIPMGFYRLSRKNLRIKADFTGKILPNFYWEAGYTFNWMVFDEFRPQGYQVDAIANGEKVENTSLFALYKAWGIIPEAQVQGGKFVSGIKFGLMYDSRDRQNNPTKGIWAEVHGVIAPKWLGSTDESYKISATMRQYVPLGTEKVIFAYRLAYEGFLGKNTPWYMLPFYTNMGYQQDQDAIGGYRTVRGLMLNRVQGLHTGFYNIEFRYRFIDFKLFNQNIAFAVSAFTDGAHVFKGYDLTNKTGMYPELYKKYIDIERACDGFHGSAGAGLRFIMNENFIVAFEYAHSFNKQDGKGAFYINTGFLF